MEDNQITSNGQAGDGSGQAAAGNGVVVDKNKSAEDYIKEVEGLYIVPALVREKFGDLVKLIYETESMDKEEREYWLEIMPIMSEEQIVKFRDILVNEKEQLSALDKEQNAQKEAALDSQPKAIDEEAIRKKIEELKAEEEVQERAEEAEEDALLRQLDEL